VILDELFQCYLNAKYVFIYTFFVIKTVIQMLPGDINNEIMRLYMAVNNFNDTLYDMHSLTFVAFKCKTIYQE
jgi:hypothetical protein